ncbi:ATP-binding protein [Polaribacter sp. Z022]|uniref:sensor histidine kinase n=1 Tax=Polaribacter sp. Z022 TaxID=2927125 RepID=UPI0020207E8B|nr:ATP-binding protein [Polaribacter sp. Z022]
MKTYFKVFLFLLMYSQIYGQNITNSIELGIPKTTKFLPNDYNGEAQNFDFIQDDKGVLYVANTVGFLEFNGTSWRSFKPNNDGVPLSFAKNKEGKIYTGGTSFIGYLDKNINGETIFISIVNKLPKDFVIGNVWDIFLIENDIFFRNDKNIIKLKNEVIEIIDAPENIQNLFQYNNQLFISTNKGLYSLTKNKFTLLDSSEIPIKTDIRAIVKAKNNSLNVVTLRDGIFSLKNNKLVPLKIKASSFFKEKMVFTARVLSDKKIAFSTIKGGILITDNSFNPLYRISEKGGLSNNSSKKIKQDYQGNLWIGSDKGITKINYPITTTFFHHNKSKIGTIEEITSHKNDIFIGASNGTFKLHKIFQEDLLTENHYPEFKHLPNDQIDNFANFSLGNKFLFGGMNQTQSFENGKSSFINSFSPRKFYKSIHYPNVLYMGHAYGCEILFLNKNNNIISSKTIKNLPEIRGVAEDKNKNLWLTSVSDGVYKVSFNDNFENITIKQFLEKDGLPSLRDNLVYNINNNQVLYTTHKGLYKFDEISQNFIPETRFGNKYAGGKDEFIYAFNFDKNENVWMHSFRNKIATAAIKNNKGTYDLLEKPLLDIGKMQAYEILSEPDKNVVWYGGSDGLARLDLSKVNTKKDTIFNALISKILGSNDSLLVGGHQFNKSKNNKLEANHRDIRFEVGATDFTNLKGTKYQYFLEGYDTKWSDFTKEPFKIYTNLNDGNYTFKVRAKNEQGNLSIPDFYTFSVLPFWYETKLFKFFTLLLIVLSVTQIVYYFSKRKFVKKVHELELTQKYEKEKNEAVVKEKERGLKALIDAQENERSRIARELHDGVVQQIGSVILKSRHILSKMNLLETKESQELLQSLEASNQDLRTISHQMMPRALKELGILSALNDLLENGFAYSKIKYSLEHFNISERLPQKIEVTIYRIVQELINNIIKHSKATEVSVQLFNANNVIILIVEDNGVGFTSDKNKKGIGLLNITSRLDMVNGNVNFEPSPKSGTLVTIKIPLQ